MFTRFSLRDYNFKLLITVYHRSLSVEGKSLPVQ